MELLLSERIFKTVFSAKSGFAASRLSRRSRLPAAITDLPLSTSETLTQGYVIDQQQIDQVPVGSSREQVLLALGTPSTTATFDNEVFYYISQTRVRRVAFMNPKLVDQRVLAVYFGEDGRVEQHRQLRHAGRQDLRLRLAHHADRRQGPQLPRASCWPAPARSRATSWAAAAAHPAPTP